MEASISNKIGQILKHGLLYGLTSSLQSLLGFLLLPLLTSFYTAEEFGVYSLLLVMGSFASAIFYLGASSALGRYYYEEDNDSYRKGIISSALQITVFGAIFLILIATFLSSKISLLAFQTTIYASQVQLAFCGVAFTFLLNLLTLILRYENKSKVFMMTTLISVIFNFLVTYILLSQFNFGIKAPLIGLLSANVLSFLFLSTYLKKYLSPKFISKYLIILIKFGFPSLVTGLLFYVLDLVDRFIIKDLLSVVEVGIYSLGYKVASIINVLVIAPFGLIWAPLRMQNANDQDATRKLMVKVTSYMFIVGFVITLISILFGRSLMPIFFKKDEFLQATQIIPTVIIGLFLFGMQNILDYGVYYFRKLHFYIFTSILGIVFNICMNYIFVPGYGIKAAALVTTFTYLLTTGLIFMFSSRFFSVQLEWKRNLVPFFCLICLLYLYNFYPYYFDHLIFSFSFFFLTMFLIYRFWLYSEEKHAISLAVKKILV